MAGTKLSGRPGGNPDIKNYGFHVAEGVEPNTALFALRITPSDLAAIKALPDWQEKARKVLRDLAKG
jgi:hypothetical protein